MVGTFPIRGMASRPRLSRRGVVLVRPPPSANGWAQLLRDPQYLEFPHKVRTVLCRRMWRVYHVPVRLCQHCVATCDLATQLLSNTIQGVRIDFVVRVPVTPTHMGTAWVRPDQLSFQQVVGSIGTFDLSALVAWLVNTVVLMGVSRFVADVVAFNFLSESERCAMHACAGVRRGGGSNERHGM